MKVPRDRDRAALESGQTFPASPVFAGGWMGPHVEFITVPPDNFLIGGVGIVAERVTLASNA